MTLLNESIIVNCRFEKGRTFPLSFEWQQQLYPVLRTVFQYKTSQGNEALLIFSCETKAGVFDLVFNLKTLSWRLKAFHQPT